LFRSNARTCYLVKLKKQKKRDGILFRSYSDEINILLFSPLSALSTDIKDKGVGTCQLSTIQKRVTGGIFFFAEKGIMHVEKSIPDLESRERSLISGVKKALLY